ncbi:hypothetical protein [Bradyrhizobium algeriense]|uniref:hypothetical protein n=1 Tax=Bradyrhizobium algeriense TaxID=634784 RepID=UPI001FCE61EC|nr:hypothetical protein [Bradyrhizobium algeriense]
MGLLPPDIDTALRIDTTKAGFTPAFLLGELSGASVPRLLFGGCEKIFALHATFRHDPILWFRPAGGTTNMRAFALGLIFSAAAFPCLAQTVLKSEPLMLAPYEVAFVQDPACGAGKVRKVTGAIRGLQRRKACVTLASEQASLVSATP